MDTDTIIVKKPRKADSDEYELFYPESEELRGHISCQGIRFNGSKITMVESHSSTSYDYYRECKAVDKAIAEKIAKEMEKFYSDFKFIVRRRINWKKHKSWRY